MNRKTFKKILLSLLMAMLLAFPCLTHAASTDISPFETYSITATFDAISSKSAKFNVAAMLRKPASYITVRGVLQSSAPNENKFRDVVGIDPIIKTVYNAKSISASGNFPITSYLDYRIKVQITENSDGFDATKTKYVDLN